ncbi:hypothetical protein J4526_06225 [Desulfurococcaceae archaeon MEX13E-LK6-19]|nr:hypothetical protein J4526_06225 [Desulfurococcaceae archaeon MEX13E-LK6-19]
MPDGNPPPIRGCSYQSSMGFDYGLAVRAIETVKNLLTYLVIGPPLIKRGPKGEIHVDVPLMYQGFALDRIHYDPLSGTPSPKGRPVRALGVSVSPEQVKKNMDKIISELRVVEAVEFREPENAWVVPIAWKYLIIAHIKVSYDGSEIIPDYGLTEEVRRYVA